MHQNIFRNPVDVEDRLQQLGLSKELLIAAVEAGLYGWLNCTENHPPSFPGVNAWAEGVRSLRESLLPKGWERLNDRNLPLTVNRATNVAITASSGDECTGVEDMAPRTRNPKGVTTKQKVNANAQQLGLFADMTASAEELIEEVKKWNTWFLLSHRDEKKKVVRCELSRPIGIGVDGRVDGWHERIILDEIPFGGDEVLLTRGDGDGGRDADGSVELDSGSDAIDVEVKRRA